MGEIRGLGLTPSPLMLGLDENMAYFCRAALENSGLPEARRDPASWPAPFRRGLGDDGGLAAARAHRAQVVAGFCRAREILDDFAPEVVVIWGDDQYENFKEDVVPAFCVQAYDDVEARPWRRYRFGPNVWGEDGDKAFLVRGHRRAAQHLASGLLEAGTDIAYSFSIGPRVEFGAVNAIPNTPYTAPYEELRLKQGEPKARRAAMDVRASAAEPRRGILP